MAYGPINETVRWNEDMRRRDTWSILPAYTVDGYLPCTGIKKASYNSDQLKTVGSEGHRQIIGLRKGE